ncbi:hypothetical protein BLGI_1421 [Brevibacillus laterosporus GI-9]|nr:hypothetical protein BLGI_1421 [Brevibacillus laterosporus GI-9]
MWQTSYALLREHLECREWLYFKRKNEEQKTENMNIGLPI